MPVEASQFTPFDRVAFAVLAAIGGLLSITGATLIAYMVLFRKGYPRSNNQPQQQTRERPTYQRLLLAMSIYTILLATFSAIGPLAVPRSTGGYGCLGNQATCSAQGFFFQFGMGELIYNVGLSVYYVAVIRYNMKDKFVVQRLEPAIHVWAFVVAVTLGGSGLAFNSFNPQVIPELGCWFSPFPISCYDSPHTCERGRYFEQFSLAVYAQQWLYVTIVIVMSALLYFTVKNQHRSMSTYASRESLQMREKSREVAYQALYFAAACLFVNMWPIIATTVFKFDVAVLPTKIILYLGSFATSSQGFFNFLIYIRPRYLRLRRRKPGAGRWNILYDVIRGESTGESQRCIDATSAGAGPSSASLFSLPLTLFRMLPFAGRGSNSTPTGRDAHVSRSSAISRVVSTAAEVKEEDIADTNSLSDPPDDTKSIAEH